jgi:TRAP-type C4-dicarboxylate transport system permease small subunit
VLAAIAIVELWIAVLAFTFVLGLTMVQVGYRYLFVGSIWWAQVAPAAIKNRPQLNPG